MNRFKISCLTCAAALAAGVPALADEAAPADSPLAAEARAAARPKTRDEHRRELMDACDGQLIIPMTPGSESLNAAVAASLILWEMTRNTIER